MKRKPNKKSIGLFFITGVIALLFIVGQALISRLWPDDKYMAVMYFNESVKGLSVGSPVVFNGVEIGKVVRISLVADPQTLTFQTPVYVRLIPVTKSQNNFWQVLMNNRRQSLQLLIEKGLRARLLTQNYLTGQLMIELSMNPSAPLNLAQAAADAHQSIPEIPTLLSPAGELTKGLDNLPIQDSFDKINATLTTLEKELPVLLPALTKSAQNLQSLTGEIQAETLDSLNQALSDTSDAMRSLRNLTDYLQEYPESLLKGKR